jgi:formylmethanofuran dehydrogenase subunit E
MRLMRVYEWCVRCGEWWHLAYCVDVERKCVCMNCYGSVEDFRRFDEEISGA